MTELSAQDLLNAERLTTMARVEALTAEFDDIVAGTDVGNSDDEHDRPRREQQATEAQQHSHG